MQLELSTTILQEIADALMLKRMCGIKPEAADAALKEFNAAVIAAQQPKPQQAIPNPQGWVPGTLAAEPST